MKAMEEEVLIKNGEIKILRDSLHQTESILEEQRRSHFLLEQEKAQALSDREKEFSKKVTRFCVFVTDPAWPLAEFLWPFRTVPAVLCSVLSTSSECGSFSSGSVRGGEGRRCTALRWQLVLAGRITSLDFRNRFNKGNSANLDYAKRKGVGFHS